LFLGHGGVPSGPNAEMAHKGDLAFSA